MSWEKKRYRVVYYSNTEATYRWVDIEKNPYLPLSMQAKDVNEAVLNAVDDKVPSDWLFANIYTEENRCVDRIFNPRLTEGRNENKDSC